MKKDRNTSTGRHVLEWAPDGVRWLDSASGAVQEASSIGAVSGALKGAICVAIGRRLVFVRQVKAPDAPLEDIKQVLVLQASQLFPLPLQEMAWGVRLTGERSRDGRVVVLYAMQITHLRALRDALQSAGLRADTVLPVALGAPYALREAGYNDGVLLERTSTGWGIDVVRNGELRYSRLAPASLSPEEALDEARRAAVAAGMPDSPPVLTAGIDLAEAQDRVDSPLRWMGRADIGRLGEGLELPEDHMRRVRAANTRIMAIGVATLVIGLLLLAAGAWRFTRETRQVLQTRQALNKSVAAIEKTRAGYTARRNILEPQIKMVTEAMNPAQPSADVLRALSQCTPQDVWLTSVSLERGRPIAIRGASMKQSSVGAMVLAMQKSPRFTDVRLLYANDGKIGESPVVQFAMTASATGVQALPGGRRTGGRR